MAMPMPPIPLRDRPTTGPAVAAFDLRACFDGPAVGALLAACRPEDRDEVVAWIRDETGCSWAADTQPDGRRP
jgi:hypothetical protein